jgi:hypothetical protein
MKKTLKYIALILSVAFIVFLIYSLMFGRLVVYSPFIFGFDHYETPRTIVYFHHDRNSFNLPPLEPLMAQTEKFHNLKFKHKIRIFMATSDSECRRLAGASPRFDTMPLYGTIVISPKAQKQSLNSQFPIAIFMRHEFSHALIYQNMSLKSALNYPGWFLEGIATYSSDMFGADGYYTKQQVRDVIRKGYFLNPDDWGTILRHEKPTVNNFPLPQKFKFIYSEYACIVGDLIELHGKDKLLEFMRLLMFEPDVAKAFYDVYKTNYKIYLLDFRKREASKQ